MIDQVAHRICLECRAGNYVEAARCCRCGCEDIRLPSAYRAADPVFTWALGVLKVGLGEERDRTHLRRAMHLSLIHI